MEFLGIEEKESVSEFDKQQVNTDKNVNNGMALIIKADQTTANQH